jgi:hypothetical protein
VYAKRPFAGPEAVLAYLSRYTHRVAIANSRLTEFNDQHVSFTYKDYRMKGRMKPKTMQLDTLEFMRRFMLHVLPSGFHRIRHCGLLASRTKLALARRLLDMPEPETTPTTTSEKEDTAPFNCLTCQSAMTITAVRQPLYLTRAPPKDISMYN